MSLRVRLIRLLVLGLLTPVLFLLSCQSSLIYHPRAYDEHALTSLKRLHGRELSFQTPQGLQKAYFVPPREGSASTAPLWLCFAGNGSLALHWLPLLRQWDARFSYLLVDYPSYGACAGRPDPESIRANGVAAFSALAQHLQIKEADLLSRSQVLGHSLGAAAALSVAEKLNLRRAILIAPFTTMTEMAQRVVGWPLCHLNRHRFDNRTALKTIAARESAQLILFHGAEDEVIPAQMGRELAAEHPGQVLYQEIPGLHHNDILHHAAHEIGVAMLGQSGL